MSDSVLKHGKRGILSPLDETKFYALEFDSLLKEILVELIGKRVVDNIVSIPLIGEKIYLGREINPLLIEQALHLNKTPTIPVELAFAVEDTSVSYLVEHCFSYKGK